MNYTFELNNKTNKESLAATQTSSADNQSTPICMSGAGNEAFYCGLLDDNGVESDKK
ncbi:hypothetical protein [uncultured Microscilla sp.]|uniref:hypothetical protein n=1 Tax=uncultured Microscilla sp. TaxID=432653 RepID=UPI002613FAA1|nr:hypothetical protein [uncultured Microscilla sp.]